MIKERAISGSRAADNDFVSLCGGGNYVVSLSGTHICRGYEEKRSIELDDELLNKGVLVLGQPGAGKSNVIIYMAHQIISQMHPEDIAVFFVCK